ncbi:hypothetical protein Mapa_004912 [Marchantia paleacea]|nr:hypothetical protein Mapa_004912 [Marchantia paleacea]
MNATLTMCSVTCSVTSARSRVLLFMIFASQWARIVIDVDIEAFTSAECTGQKWVSRNIAEGVCCSFVSLDIHSARFRNLVDGIETVNIVFRPVDDATDVCAAENWTNVVVVIGESPDSRCLTADSKIFGAASWSFTHNSLERHMSISNNLDHEFSAVYTAGLVSSNLSPSNL